VRTEIRGLEEKGVEDTHDGSMAQIVVTSVSEIKEKWSKWRRRKERPEATSHGGKKGQLR
jgi:hypothetical protein